MHKSDAAPKAEPKAEPDVLSQQALQAARQGKSLGLASSLGAFSLWGVLPVYWKQLAMLEPMLLLLHRIIWSFVFLAIAEIKAKRLRATLAHLKNKRQSMIIALRSLLLAANWGLYIWAVNNNHIIEASLGYFLNPLFNSLLGIIFFKERPNVLQKFSILLAFTGVSVQVVMFGSIPAIGLGLALCFAAYGALRKKDSMPAIPGLFLETTLICPLVIAALIWYGLTGGIGFDLGAAKILMLIGAGPVTSIPLLLFAYGAQRLNLTTVGLTQYLSPTFTLLIGTFVYNEQLSDGHLISFIFIWIALAIYTFESLRLYNANAKFVRQKGCKIPVK
jgi:chloramphenicol-sensitive protein RarD